MRKTTESKKAAKQEGPGAAGAPLGMPPSVNYHLWEPCNMRCRFCFATFQDVRKEILPQGHLCREDSLRLVERLAPFFEKITFAGGEPTLCPWLWDLVHSAKHAGMKTMLVTNGSHLPASEVAARSAELDWIVLSIDSASEATHAELGRAVRGEAISEDRYVALAEAIHAARIRLKINTVVTALNASEDLSPLIKRLRPERWKVLQVLPVEGQNSGSVEPLLCSAEAFDAFVARHRSIEESGITLVPEDNNAVRGSYAMVDPAGRFFDNTEGHHRYGRPILEVGVEAAWSSVRFSMAKFLKRGGDYTY